MTPHFIFCSGWGFKKRFWDPLLKYFKPGSYTVLETAYEKENRENTAHKRHSSLLPNVDLTQRTDRTFIGIGHSLGFKKLLDLPVTYDQLIGLQAFTCFTGFEGSLAQKRLRLLKTMIKSFSYQPQAVLRQFYQKCEVNAFSEIQLSQPDKVSLAQDLQLLLDSQSSFSKTPLMILGTSHDKIVPPVVIYDNFSRMKNVTIEILDLQGHCLGYQHPDIVFEKIVNFVDVAF